MQFRVLSKVSDSQIVKMANGRMYKINYLVPLRSLPPIIMAGVLFSAFDLFRRAAL